MGEHYAVAPFTGINSAGDTFQHRCPCGEGLVSICSGLLAERERAGRVMERLQRLMMERRRVVLFIDGNLVTGVDRGRTALERALDATGAQ